MDFINGLYQMWQTDMQGCLSGIATLLIVWFFFASMNSKPGSRSVPFSDDPRVRQNQIDMAYRDREGGMQTIRIFIMLIMGLGGLLAIYAMFTASTSFLLGLLFLSLGVFGVWIASLFWAGIRNSFGEMKENKRAQRRRQQEIVLQLKPTPVVSPKPVYKSIAELKAAEQKKQEQEYQAAREKFAQERRERHRRQREHWRKEKEKRQALKSAQFESWAKSKGIDTGLESEK